VISIDSRDGRLLKLSNNSLDRLTAVVDSREECEYAMSSYLMDAVDAIPKTPSHNPRSSSNQKLPSRPRLRVKDHSLPMNHPVVPSRSPSKIPNTTKPSYSPSKVTQNPSKSPTHKPMTQHSSSSPISTKCRPKNKIKVGTC